MAVWVHYEYLDNRHRHTATQRIRLDLPHVKCERLVHLTNHIFAKGYLPGKARSLVTWKGACGKLIEESAKVEDVLSWGEGVCETKPLRLEIGEPLRDPCMLSRSLTCTNEDIRLVRASVTYAYDLSY